MLENTGTRENRRPIILEGISQDLNHSKISARLGSNRWVVQSDIRYMRRNGDRGLKQAEKDQAQVREKKAFLFEKDKKHYKQNKRFLRMAGITLEERSFRNMIDFNKLALLKILRSEDQYAAIVKLPTSIRKTLKKNGIITKRCQDNEISKRAQEYLTSKKPAREV